MGCDFRTSRSLPGGHARSCRESGPALAPHPTFAVVRGVPSDLPPQAEWSLGMTEALKDIQARLAAEGWIQTQQGAQTWDLTYER